MKKIFIAAVVLLTSQTLFAQSVKFGIKAGATLSKLRSNTNGDIETTDNRTGLTFGGFANLKFGKLSLQPGLSYVSKGGKEVESGTEVFFGQTVTYSTESDIKIEYLELPVNLLYNVPLGLGHFYIGGGPYAAYGLSGKVKFDSEVNGQKDSESEDLEFGDGEDQLKKMDFGVNGVTGLKLKNGLDLGISYGLGLANISNENSVKGTNRSISFTLGYSF